MNMERKKTQPGRGKLIAFEGIDGSGKSTQAAILTERLQNMGVDCYPTTEPSSGPVGLLIRQVLTGRMKMDNRAFAALFAADRLDHLLNEVNGIAAKVEAGTTVITDRYYFSSYAYHSVDVPMDWVIATNAQSSRILRPAVTVWIDVDPDVALERISRNRFQQELFEKKSRLVQVRENYVRAFERLAAEETVVRIDGEQSPEKIANDVWDVVRQYL